ncbi:MAG: M50 family metallopeptidase [Clostridia bacterium]|nr:M50 family metallopeptidase [Clostridia bacterium]
MRRKTSSTIWAIVCTILLIGGEVASFFFAWQTGTWTAMAQLGGFVVGLILAPIFHELGHIIFAKSQDMQIVYAKFSFLKLREKQGKLSFALASPFGADETQAIPRCGGNMQKRARLYTVGGLIFGGIWLGIIALISISLVLFVGGVGSYAVLGLLPYGAYLFLLNVLPCEYGSGKTDMLVYRGLKNNEPAESTMVSAMEIQGRLYAGESYAEIDETLYFDVAQLPEDEPLFAVMLDLRYRYYLDKGDMKNAADCLNRLVNAQAYLTEGETEKIAAELVYMHVLNGDMERATACGKGCASYLQSNTVSAKRILTAVAVAGGKAEEAEILKNQAKTLLNKEKIIGEKRFEERLLSRLHLA